VTSALEHQPTELPKYEKRAAAYTTAVADMVKVRPHCVPVPCLRVRLGWVGAGGVGRVLALLMPKRASFWPFSSPNHYSHTWCLVTK
jgi:hypothetical protein